MSSKVFHCMQEMIDPFHAKKKVLRVSLGQKIHYTALVDLRFSLSFLYFGNNMRFSPQHYMELRENVMLLFPTSQIVKHSRGPLSENELQFMTSQELSVLARRIPAKHVLLFFLASTDLVELRDASVILRSKKNSYTRMFFPSEYKRDGWLLAMKKAYNKNLQPGTKLGNFRCRSDSRLESAFQENITPRTTHKAPRVPEDTREAAPNPLLYRIINTKAAWEWAVMKLVLRRKRRKN